MKAKIASVCVVLLAFVGGGIASSLAHDEPSGSEDSGGGVVARAPGETVPVIGPNGEFITCPDGEMLEVDPAHPAIPPGLTETEDAPKSIDATIPGEVDVVTRAAVPRCGPDGGGDGADPVWVPESIGADHPTTAPRRFVP